VLYFAVLLYQPSLCEKEGTVRIIPAAGRP
jgi:hypothetical protein